MVQMPAKCPGCGNVFQSGYDMSGAIEADLSGNTVSCPRCGGKALLVEGVMTVEHGGIEMISGPAWSWDVVEQLRLTLRRVMEEAPDDALTQVELVLPPDLRPRVRRLADQLGPGGFVALLALLLQVVQWGSVTPSDIKAWVEEVPRQIEKLLDAVETDGLPTTGPGAT